MRLASIFKLVMLAVALGCAAPAFASTDAKTDPNTAIPCPPAPCISMPQFKDYADKIINNTGKALTQGEKTEAASEMYRNANNQFMYNDANYRESSRNRETRNHFSYDQNVKNRASATSGQESAALTTTGTVANMGGAVPNALARLVGAYNDADHTAEDIHSGARKGIAAAIASACKNKCVSKEMASALKTIRGIDQCDSDPDVAGSWVDPNALRKGLPKNKSISLAPGSKEVKCLASYNQIVHAAMGVDDVHRKDKGDPAQAIDVAARKARAESSVLASLAGLRSDMSVPNKAVSDTKQYDTREKMAKKYGIDCRKSGDLPSRRCSDQSTMAAIRGQHDQLARQIDMPGAQADAIAATLSSAAAITRGLAQLGDNTYGGGPDVALNTTSLITEYLSRPDIQKYMASAEFVQDVHMAMLDLPRVEHEVDVAMNAYYGEMAQAQQEYRLSEAYPKEFARYYAENHITPPDDTPKVVLAELAKLQGTAYPVAEAVPDAPAVGPVQTGSSAPSTLHDMFASHGAAQSAYSMLMAAQAHAASATQAAPMRAVPVSAMIQNVQP